MNILITGANGFIGSNLTEFLLNKGHHVRGFSLDDVNKPFNDSNVSDNLEVLNGDIKKQDICDRICENIDVIYHLAGLADVSMSFKQPEPYIDTNVKGTLNICKSAVNKKVKRILIMSSGDVYGIPEYTPIDENHSLNPISPYSASKIGAEAIATSFYNSYRLPITIVRSFNIYGPKQSMNAFIPKIIYQLIKGKLPISIGNIKTSRDFNYISDFCDGITKLASSENSIGEIVNIGSGCETSLEDLINTIFNLMNIEPNYVIDKSFFRQNDILKAKCDISKINKLIGYEPLISLKQGLMLTIEWLKKIDRQ